MTSKRQVTIPKDVADRYGIGPGDEILWIPAGDEIRVIVPAGTAEELTAGERLRLFDWATERIQQDESGALDPSGQSPRGWTRDELYDRSRPD